MTRPRNGGEEPPWLLFIFRLSAQKASKRVSVWRQLQKYGALNWKNCAYLLPLSASNLERFHWLGAEVQKYQGDASVVEVLRIHGHTDRQVMTLFNSGRARQYENLIRDIRLALRAAASRSRAQQLLDFSRLNRRLTELNAIDFFGCGKRKEAEDLMKELEVRARSNGAGGTVSQKKTGEYRGRLWQTRPRPEVDRVGSAWLIKHFIDPKARFVFSSDPEAHPGAVRFDMFGGEFTHVGDDCTFETLMQHFKLRDKRLEQIAQIIHDADLEDNKFGRPEGTGIELITKGWGKMDWTDEEILRKGFELFDALYLTLGTKKTRVTQEV
jgi:hypothetical protein